MSNIFMDKILKPFKNTAYLVISLALVSCGGGGGGGGGNNNSNGDPSSTVQEPTPKIPPEWQEPNQLITYSGNGSSGFGNTALKRNSISQIMLAWLEEGANFDDSLVGMMFDKNVGGWSQIRTFSGNSDNVYGFSLDLNNAGNVSMAWVDRPATNYAVLNDQAWGFASLGSTLVPAARLDTNDNDSVSLNGPQTVIDDNGNITSVWIQKERVWVSQYTVVSGLKPPETLDTGLARARVAYIDNDDAGNVMVVWLEYGDAAHNIVTNYYQVGVGWLGAETLWSGESALSSIAVAMNDQGKTLVAWFGDQRFEQDKFLANIYTPGLGWEGEKIIQDDAHAISSSIFARAKLANNDSALLVWRDWRDELWGAAYTPSHDWSTPIRLDNEVDTTVYDFTLDIKADGSGLLTWGQGSYNYFNVAEIYTRFYDPDIGWESFEKITNGEESVTLIDSIFMYDSEALIMWKVREDNSEGSLWTAEYK